MTPAHKLSMMTKIVYGIAVLFPKYEFMTGCIKTTMDMQHNETRKIIQKEVLFIVVSSFRSLSITCLNYHEVVPIVKNSVVYNWCGTFFV
ncbi:hypothetical protein HMPREF9104_02110 [Lentilactobacillus kisonensis F0435]|uniref:Uncharacterized protein n=1 Tax=Lentilactobacillus kisonensis F0435 TaxID=797516 RepID=H1LHL9_9LACO|nr:hypothetical protein HMPREF9104_02110 [Lentilactobacillus kisonensis F0435]